MHNGVSHVIQKYVHCSFVAKYTNIDMAEKPLTASAKTFNQETWFFFSPENWCEILWLMEMQQFSVSLKLKIMQDSECRQMNFVIPTMAKEGQ